MLLRNLKFSNDQYAINIVNRQMTDLGENYSNLEEKVCITNKDIWNTDNAEIKIYKRKMSKGPENNQFTEELLWMDKNVQEKHHK